LLRSLIFTSEGFKMEDRQTDEATRLEQVLVIAEGDLKKIEWAVRKVLRDIRDKARHIYLSNVLTTKARREINRRKQSICRNSEIIADARRHELFHLHRCDD